MQKVVILGAGGFAREVLDIFLVQREPAKQYEIIGFIDENPAMKGKELNGYPVLGSFDWFSSNDKNSIRVICGIGNPVTRRKVVRKALDIGLQFCNIIHPTAVLTPFVSIGTGVIITAGCIFTNRIKVGDHVHINLDCTIGHDSVIEDFCTVNPGVHISGNVHIRTGCDVGTGTTIIQGITIGEWSITGAGCVITKDVPPNVTIVGVPGKVIKTRNEEWYLR
jgi:sugar O-acyltransferase (sialic acid O-acetyltransferase NeuD family)